VCDEFGNGDGGDIGSDVGSDFSADSDAEYSGDLSGDEGVDLCADSADGGDDYVDGDDGSDFSDGLSSDEGVDLCADDDALDESVDDGEKFADEVVDDTGEDDAETPTDDVSEEAADNPTDDVNEETSDESRSLLSDGTAVALNDNANAEVFGEFQPYLPVSPKYSEQYAALADQYGAEENPQVKEQIRALGELLALENTLDLSDGDPNTTQLGGKYGDIKGLLEGYDAHHIPPKSVSDNNINDLPAICMTGVDHAQTSSYGGRMNSKPGQPMFIDSPIDTRPYKDRLIEQINNGNYADAFRNELYEIKHLFGDKYDGAIRQAIDANRNYLTEFGNPRVHGKK
jgi:hypothetical protein